MRKSKDENTKRIDRAFRQMATDAVYLALCKRLEEEFRFADHEALLPSENSLTLRAYHHKGTKGGDI